jgi:hypothetical protein
MRATKGDEAQPCDVLQPSRSLMDQRILHARVIEFRALARFAPRRR